jgi:galactose mutarotase-like enzyme
LLDALGERCFTLRHAGDAARLREVLQPERSVVIVGAGTIGLEPMSHAPDDHHRPEGGDLIALAPGESTTSEMSLRVEWL